jgi:glyoxylase-like metal-dependent hydrolase (beta-lactamase superfamily II)
LTFDPVPIHAHNPGPFTGEGNTTWLVAGRVPVLIDAGTGDSRYLDDLCAALGSARLARVLVTHAHSDHAGGAAAIAERMPHVRFAKMPWPDRDRRYPVRWEWLRDEERIEAGDEELVAVHTPGHAPDHLCLWHRASGTVFCGDLAVAGSTVVIPASSGGDLAAYMTSLERVLGLQPSRLLPAHGPVIEEPETLLRRYLAHRREREEQILAALRAGDTSVETIVARVYAELSSALVGMARDSVTAHLLKLEREGRVSRTARGWTII